MTKRLFWQFIFLMLSGVAFWLFIWRVNTPIGYVTNWDFFHHTVAVNNISAGNFNLVLSQISDTFTFNGYTPFFHLPFAILHKISGWDTLAIFWWSELVYYLFSIAVSFWIGHKILNSSWGGFLTGLVGALIFESNVAYTNLYLLPQTVAATLGSFLLIKVLTKTTIRISLGLIIGSLIVFTTHFVIGAAYLICLGMLLALKKVKLPSIDWRPVLLITPIILITISVYLGATTKIPLPGRLDAADFIFSTQDKLGFFYQWFGLLPFVLIPAGVSFLWRRHEPSGDIFLFLSLSILAVALFPFSYALKFYTLGHYFIDVVAAAGMIAFLDNFNTKLVKAILGTGIMFALMANLLVNTITTMQSSFNGQTSSFVSSADFEAAKWLKDNYGSRQAFLISDPETQAVLEATTGINTQGGAFPRLDTVHILGLISTQQDPAGIAGNLLTIHDTLNLQNAREVTLFDAGGRYFIWQNFPAFQKESYFYEVWTPQQITPFDENKIITWSKNPHLKLVYQNQEHAIFEIN